MKLDRRLLWIAPLLALMVVLGPLTGNPDGNTANASERSPAGTENRTDAGAMLRLPVDETRAADTTSRPPGTGGVGDALPQFPSLLEVGGALLLVCAIGAAALWGLSRLRGSGGTSLLGGAVASRGGTTGPISVRQSVRLSPRASVHAVEFDGRLLLIGEGEHGPSLLEDAQAARDAHELAQQGIDPGAELADSRLEPAPRREPLTRREPALHREPAPAREPARMRETPRAAEPAMLSNFEDVLRAARPTSDEGPLA